MSTKLIAEYVWLDNNQKFRSKSRTLEIKSADDLEIKNLPQWSYDGSSTNQASSKNSEVVLQPVRIFNCPFRGGNNVLILCDTYDHEGEPTISNKRFEANIIFEDVVDQKPWFGLEQEYFMVDRNTNKPLGFPQHGYPESQGKYYCGVGAGRVFGRKLADLHYQLCLKAGIEIHGINAEVAPGQWEFQIGPCTGIEAGDHLWMARYILERVAELSNIIIEYDPKPLSGDWNGSGCHTNFSTLNMRRGSPTKTGLDFIIEGIEKLRNHHQSHVKSFGNGNERRLTGNHETSNINEFTYSVANRSVSIRIPHHVSSNDSGYFEDRRPASNCDPYVVTSLITEAVCL